MAEGRLYQGYVVLAMDVVPPSGRIYQASASITPAPPTPTGRLYQAYAVTAAGGTGTGRLYQAYAVTSLNPDTPASGLRTRRGGNTAAVTTRTYRNGEL